MATLVPGEERVAIAGPTDVERVRRQAASLARSLLFPETTVAHIELITLELATNVLVHAHEGVIALRATGDGGGQPGIVIEAVDGGPGLGDVELAFRDGYSTGRGLGRGLGMVKRLSDRLEVQTSEQGTRIAAVVLR